jgi:hypothetical protein
MASAISISFTCIMILWRMKFALCFLLGLDFLKLAHLINLTKKERRIDKRGMILIIQSSADFLRG